MPCKTMITLFVEENNPLTPNFYNEMINNLQFHQLTCPCGHSGCLSVHGYYHRHIKASSGRLLFRICPKCKDTEEPQFIKDNGKPAFIEGSYMSESLLSLIAYQKYGLYLPLYRQEKDFLQLNAPITPTRAGENARRFLNGTAPGFSLLRKTVRIRTVL